MRNIASFRTKGLMIIAKHFLVLIDRSCTVDQFETQFRGDCIDQVASAGFEPVTTSVTSSAYATQLSIGSEMSNKLMKTLNINGPRTLL